MSWAKIATDSKERIVDNHPINCYASNIVEKWPTKAQLTQLQKEENKLVTRNRCVNHAVHIIRKNKLWNCSFSMAIKHPCPDTQAMFWYNNEIFEEALSLVKRGVRLEHIPFPSNTECQTHIIHLKKIHPEYNTMNYNHLLYEDPYMYFNFRYYEWGSTMYSPFSNDSHIDD